MALRSGFESFARAVGAAGLVFAVGAPGKSRALDGDREGNFLAALADGVMLSRCEAESVSDDEQYAEPEQRRDVREGRVNLFLSGSGHLLW